MMDNDANVSILNRDDGINCFSRDKPKSGLYPTAFATRNRKLYLVFSMTPLTHICLTSSQSALLHYISPSNEVNMLFSFYLYTLAASPSLGGSRQHKRNNKKQWGFHSVLLAMTRDPAEFGWHRWSNTAHPPQLMSLHICHLPYCPYHRVAPIKQLRGRSRCQSELRHNHSPLIPIPSKLTCLPYIHPPKPKPSPSTPPINFCIHYLFQ